MKYYSFNQYARDTFGEKVYKLSLDGGFTCPNRDGTLDTRGCIFCSAGGSGEFAGTAVSYESRKPSLNRPSNEKAAAVLKDAAVGIKMQMDFQKKLLAAKFPGQDRKYVAYFQAYTNTYGPPDKMRSLFTEAIRQPEIVALSVATRPDCLPEEVLSLLAEQNRIKPVWVELGLQTIHEKTASYIRRGYPLSVYDRALADLKKIGIDVITHVILGLPGETREDMLKTVSYVANSSSKGIKLSLLHVLRGTDLADDYEAGLFTCMDLESYADLVADCLALLPEDMVVHRLTGDGARKDLIAPLWSTDKKRVLNLINRKIALKNKNLS